MHVHAHAYTCINTAAARCNVPTGLAHLNYCKYCHDKQQKFHQNRPDLHMHLHLRWWPAGARVAACRLATRTSPNHVVEQLLPRLVHTCAITHIDALQAGVGLQGAGDGACSCTASSMPPGSLCNGWDRAFLHGCKEQVGSHQRSSLNRPKASQHTGPSAPAVHCTTAARRHP